MTEIQDQPIPAQNMPNPQIYQEVPPITPESGGNKKTFLIVLGLLFFVVLAAFGAWYAYSASLLTSQQAMPSVISLPKNSVKPEASLLPVSSDDSLQVLDAEVEDSQVPDFTQEFQQIEQDIKGL